MLLRPYMEYTLPTAHIERVALLRKVKRGHLAQPFSTVPLWIHIEERRNIFILMFPIISHLERLWNNVTLLIQVQFSKIWPFTLNKDSSMGKRINTYSKRPRNSVKEHW